MQNSTQDEFPDSNAAKGAKSIIKFARESLPVPPKVPSVNVYNLDSLKEKSAAIPAGVLAIWIEQFQVNTMDCKNIFGKDEINIYLRLLFKDQVKYTKVISNISPPFCLILDDLKHFLIEPSEDIDKRLGFEFIGYCSDKPMLHKILCRANICVLTIIGCKLDRKKIHLKGEKETSHVVASLEYEFVFSYGAFGYGFSNQLLHHGKSPQSEIQNSLFYRPEPPLSRADILNDVIQSQHVGHPSIIDFDRKIDIGSTMQEFSSEIEIYKTSDSQRCNKELLNSKLSESLKTKQDQLKQVKNAKGRINYLNKLILNKDRHKNIDDQHLLVTYNFNSASSRSLLSDRKLSVVENPSSFGIPEAYESSLIAADEDHHFMGNIMSMVRRFIMRLRSLVGNNVITPQVVNLQDEDFEEET